VTLTVQEQRSPEHDAEALIKEAGRRQRRRRAAVAAVGLVVVGVIVAAVVELEGGGGSKASPGSQRPTGPSATVATVTLKQPTALAVSSAGVLYIVDPARDQILRRLPSGRFAVVAGSGSKGFSGDGGLATKAALRLTEDSDVAVSANGTIYFADTGNGRVRAVLQDRRIETFAGDGRRTPQNVNPPYLTGSRQALHTDLVDPSGLAFGPGGKLYISAQDVVALSRDGTLSYFAGSTHSGASGYSHLFDGYPNGIAFDRAGDLFVSSFPSLTERTATGRVVFLGDGFRSDGAKGILASSPAGTVYEGYGDAAGIVNRLIDPHPVSNGRVISTGGVENVVSHGSLDEVLGSRAGIQNGFGPSGLAIETNGAIYTDTDRGYWSSVSALVEIKPGGSVRELWRAR
jgi:sugar lactone lactonase YvrE